MKKRISIVLALIVINIAVGASNKIEVIEEIDVKVRKLPAEKVTTDTDRVKRIIMPQLDKIRMLSNTTPSSNEKNLKTFVLSTQIKNFDDIAVGIDADIKQVKEQVKLLIGKIALDIETHGENKIGSLEVNDQGAVYYIPNPSLPSKLNQKRKELLAAGLKNRVTVRSAYLALDLLSKVNNEIIKQAKAAKGRKEKETLYIKQAAYVYELSGIVISLLDELNLDGTTTIYGLRDEATLRVKTSLRNIKTQEKRAKALKEKKLISNKELKEELKSLTLISKANTRSLQGWDSLFDKIESQEQFLKQLKSKRDLIIYKQEKAKIQLETLRDLKGVAMLRGSIGSIDNLVGMVDSLNLLILDEQTVTELLGGFEADEEKSDPIKISSK